jgi:hypothetical protein
MAPRAQLTNSWQSILKTAKPEQTLARAHSGLNRDTEYMLGDGDRKPADVTQPLGKQCDCSGYVCWAIGTPRELPPGSDHWLFTDSIWAGGEGVGKGLFAQVERHAAMLGDLFVYPHDHAHPHGHIGIVTEIGSDGSPARMIHCSLSNYHNTGDAVRITTAEVIGGNPQARVMRVDYDALRTLAGINAAGRLVADAIRTASTFAARFGPQARLAAVPDPASKGAELVTTLRERVYTDHGPITRAVPVYRLTSGTAGYFFRAKLSIDGDGAPRCYHPTNDKIALDYLRNSSSDSRRFIQGKTGIGPAPGFFVSDTSLNHGSSNRCDSFLDAETIPYIVFDEKFVVGVNVGNLAVVVNFKTNSWTHAIYGDSNPHFVGEASIATARNLGFPAALLSPKDGGDDDDNYAYLIFPGTTPASLPTAPHWPDENIKIAATALFEAWGGMKEILRLYS